MSEPQLGLSEGRQRRTVGSITDDLRRRRNLEMAKLDELQSEVDDIRARVELLDEILVELEG